MLVGGRHRDGDRAAREQLDESRYSLRQLARQQTALRRVAELVAREAQPADVFSAVADEMADCLDVYNALVVRYEGDEIVIEAAESEVERVAAIVKETMQMIHPLVVPLSVEASWGRSWYDAKE